MCNVSIVMPTYNGSKYLLESVNSCLHQTYTNLELIVVVDSRTNDSSLEVLKGIDDPRLKTVMFHEPGQARALNYGFSQARGKLFSWTHDDNIYCPAAIEYMVQYVESESSCHMVITEVEEIDDAGTSVKKHSQLISCFLYRRSCRDSIGEYDPRFELVHDSHYWFRMAHAFGPAGWIHKDLYKYRKHTASRTSTQGAQRALVSLQMHCDLYQKNIYPYTLNAPKEFGTIKRTFFDRLGAAALHRRYDITQQIVSEAKKHHFPWVRQLESRERSLRSKVGWYSNRMYYAGRGLFMRIVKLLESTVFASSLK